MSDLDRILRLAGLATTADESVAVPADRELKEYGEEGCPCCGGGRCRCKGDCPDCNCHGNNEWDESVEEEAVTEASNGTYARIIYDYSENWGSIDIYKDHEKVDEWDDYFHSNDTGNPLAVKFVEMSKANGLDPLTLSLVDENGDVGTFNGKTFKWEDGVSVEESKPDFLDVDGDGDTEESWEDAEEDKDEMKESEWCGVCGNDVCTCTDIAMESDCDCEDEEETLEEMEVVSEAPTMDTTQLINLMRLSGINEEIIKKKLDEWANTPEGVGEIEPTVHGGDDNYAFAQSVNLSLKRYLDAQDMKVQVKEHTVEEMKALYETKKNSK